MSRINRPKATLIASRRGGLAFAMFAVWAAGAGHAWVNDDRDRELAALRSRLEVLDFIERRAALLTVAEQRQLDALMKWSRRLGSSDQPAPRSR
jgi:hypothetical protein